MNIIFNSTDRTPEISTDDFGSSVFVKGKIIPENPISYFSVITDVIMNYYKNADFFNLTFQLEYFNTGAAKYLFELLKKFDDKSKLKICWLYENDDEDIYEAGKDYQELTGLNFEFIELNNN